MSPRSPKDTREDDMQDKALHVVPDAISEARALKEDAALADEMPPVEDAKQVEFVETTVELDRVAIYLKGPTAFSA